MTRFEVAFEEWWAAVGPTDCPPIQRQEMRRAFLSGCWWLHNEVRNATTLATSNETAAILRLHDEAADAFEAEMRRLGGTMHG